MKFLIPLLVSLCWIVPVQATLVIEMQNTQTNNSIGTVEFKNTRYGLLITPNLKGLPEGIHGMHLHENPSCEMRANEAGGHYDPKNTGKHLGPYANGHLGDLPVIYVDVQLNATIPTLAPRLKEYHIKNRAVIIHQGGDNYSDEPNPLGGGGARIACGIYEPQSK